MIGPFYWVSMKTVDLEFPINQAWIEDFYTCKHSYCVICLKTCRCSAHNDCTWCLREGWSQLQVMWSCHADRHIPFLNLQHRSGSQCDLFLHFDSVHQVQGVLHSPVWTWWPGCCLSSVTLTGVEREEAWLSGRVTSFGSWNHFRSQTTQELLTWLIPQPGKSQNQSKNFDMFPMKQKMCELNRTHADWGSNPCGPSEVSGTEWIQLGGSLSGHWLTLNWGCNGSAEKTGRTEDSAGLHSWLLQDPASSTRVGRQVRTPGPGSRSRRGSARWRLPCVSGWSWPPVWLEEGRTAGRRSNYVTCLLY